MRCCDATSNDIRSDGQPPDVIISSVRAEWLDEHEPLLGVNGPHVIFVIRHRIFNLHIVSFRECRKRQS